VIFGTSENRGGDVAIGDLGTGEVLALGGFSGRVDGVAAAGDVNGDEIVDFLITQQDRNNGGFYGDYADENVDRTLGYVVFGNKALDEVDLLDVDGRIDADGDGADDVGFRIGGYSDILPYGGYYGDYNGSYYDNTSYGDVALLGGTVTVLGDIDGDGFTDLLIRTREARAAGQYNRYYYETRYYYDAYPVLFIAPCSAVGFWRFQGPGRSLSGVPSGVW